MTRTVLLAYLAALLFLSLNPWLRPSGDSVAGLVGWDKIDHAIAYGGLTMVIVSVCGGLRRGLVPIVLAVAISAGIGILTEFCQSWFTENRTFSRCDAYANGFGAVMGAAVILSLRHGSDLIRLALRRDRSGRPR